MTSHRTQAAESSKPVNVKDILFPPATSSKENVPPRETAVTTQTVTKNNVYSNSKQKPKFETRPYEYDFHFVTTKHFLPCLGIPQSDVLFTWLGYRTIHDVNVNCEKMGAKFAVRISTSKSLRQLQAELITLFNRIVHKADYITQDFEAAVRKFLGTVPPRMLWGEIAKDGDAGIRAETLRSEFDGKTIRIEVARAIDLNTLQVYMLDNPNLGRLGVLNHLLNMYYGGPECEPLTPTEMHIGALCIVPDEEARRIVRAEVTELRADMARVTGRDYAVDLWVARDAVRRIPRLLAQMIPFQCVTATLRELQPAPGVADSDLDYIRNVYFRAGTVYRAKPLYCANAKYPLISLYRSDGGAPLTKMLMDEKCYVYMKSPILEDYSGKSYHA